MMKYLFVLLFGLLIMQSAWAAENSNLDSRAFAQLPVQHNGRIEPLDSFARFYLTAFSGNTSIDSMTSDEWLVELLFAPDRAYHRAVFKINKLEVEHTLALPNHPSHRYSFLEIAAAMAAHREIVNSLISANPKNITDPAQQQLVTLYTHMTVFLDISRSLSLLLPVFEIDDAALAKKMDVPAGEKFSYLEMMRHKTVYLALAKPMMNKMSNHPTRQQISLLQIGLMLKHMEPDKQSQLLRIVPPAWQKDNSEWLSPWVMLQAGQGAPQTAALLQSWARMAQAYQNNNPTEWTAAAKDISQQNLSLAKKQIRPRALTAEYIYNHAYLFEISFGLYFTALLALLIKLGARRRIFYPVAAVLLCGGFVLHFTGEVLRIYIMARPPVGTLYESIIFVGLVVVAGSLLLEARGRNGLGLAIGVLGGFILQAIGMTFAATADNMEPLVAVLNTNFWLATHVMAITTGYGCCLLTGILGHVYLLQKILRPTRYNMHQETSRMMSTASLVALFFTLTGTILGGIWADQSWGRFWGWDPKENGALLIVLWLLSMLHGRLSGLLRANGFAMAAAATLITVTLSWFGVNLLSVGLHSYGFISGIAFNLFLFVSIEIIFIAACGLILRRRRVVT